MLSVVIALLLFPQVHHRRVSKSAFVGRLVPQDHADELASATLARLMGAPSASTPGMRGRKKRA